ncbi:MAG: beta-lactamase family protein [Anaerolineales bacterium]|nr:beta-lactamase family protein [Anaerolineales bacterium]
MQTLDFTRPVAPEEAGIDPTALTRLHDLFGSQLADGLHPAAQLVVVKDGQVVIDLAAGSFRGGKPVKPDTPFYCFSVSKAFTGICIHKLIEEGKVALDAPVAAYWPAFGKKGKEKITIRQVFHHTAGIPAIDRYRQIPLWPFWSLVMADIARLTPEFEPGSKMAYHAVTWGFIFGEVVRRVSGMSLETYFHRHFAHPLGMHNSWFRIPAKDLACSPRIISGHPDQNTLVRVFDARTIRRAVIPAASLHSTARELAVFYHMLVNQGSYCGKQYLKPDTVRQAVSLGYSGWDEINQRYSLWAYGFHLGGRKDEQQEESVFTERSTRATFGHMGNRSCMAWADMDHKLVVAFTCNRLIGNQENRKRWIALNNAVWDLMGV